MHNSECIKNKMLLYLQIICIDFHKVWNYYQDSNAAFLIIKGIIPPY